MVAWLICVVLIVSSSFGNGQNCGGMNDSFEILNNYCIHIMSRISIFGSRQSVDDYCREMDNGRVWHPPKLNSTKKNDQFWNLVSEKSNNVVVAVWIDLQRDAPATEDEEKDETKWLDPTKWRWLSDNSTLADSLHENLPILAIAPNISTSGRCVIATMNASSTTEEKEFQWWYFPCQERYDKARFGFPYVVVCELPLAWVATIQTSMESDRSGREMITNEHGHATNKIEGDPTPTNSGPRDSDWHWVVIGILACAIVICVIAGIVWYVRRHRQNRVVLAQLKERAAKSKTDDDSGSSELSVRCPVGNVSKSSQDDRPFVLSSDDDEGYMRIGKQPSKDPQLSKQLPTPLAKSVIASKGLPSASTLNMSSENSSTAVVEKYEPLKARKNAKQPKKPQKSPKTLARGFSLKKRVRRRRDFGRIRERRSRWCEDQKGRVIGDQ